MSDAIKNITRNRKAYHDYFVDDELEAGMVLLGSEVKSLRQGKVNLTDAYARFDKGELYLVNAHISPYENATHINHEPERVRKLLMHKRELRKLSNKANIAGFTLIPLALYFKGSTVKCKIGVCRGKKLFDKREDLRKRDAAREMARSHARNHRR
ncbi:SsrA-binding protein SmpB [Lujinxingia sediminis]|uniref:SsrA-binding protein n=1 Tax=Lujinxingia sediminis TaxID=2480984 RepID=A0ABY0CQ02_9DELT|nr:SsrA-binding protein SmpB [Lujinxingia sediminis]RVU42573.1 SsrA-binding protein SmpB [Lujinxingia sediminis]